MSRLDKAIRLLNLRSISMRTFLLSIGILLSTSSLAQHPFMSRFTATIVGDGIYLEWTLTAGNTCQGIRIERAAPGEAFKEVGNIEGICGSIDRDEDFTFLDNTPIGGIQNRYRLLLGLSGYTEEISIQYFNVGEEGFLLAQSEDGIRLISDRNDLVNKELALYDSKGVELQRMSLSDRETRLSTLALQQGAYILVVFDTSEAIFVEQFVKF